MDSYIYMLASANRVVSNRMATNIHPSEKKKSDRRDIFVDVSELNPMSIVRRIKVKILRIFESCTLFYETLELILVDAKVNYIFSCDYIISFLFWLLLYQLF